MKSSPFNQGLHVQRAFRKFSDSNGRSIYGDGGKYDIHAGTVLQSCIHNRIRKIHHTVVSSHDLLDHVLHLLLCGKTLIPGMHLPRFLVENMGSTIYHDLGNLRIIQQFLQGIQLTQRVKYPLFQLHPLMKGQGNTLSQPSGFLPDQITDLLIRSISGQIHPSKNLFTNSSHQFIQRRPPPAPFCVCCRQIHSTSTVPQDVRR